MLTGASTQRYRKPATADGLWVRPVIDCKSQRKNEQKASRQQRSASTPTLLQQTHPCCYLHKNYGQGDVSSQARRQYRIGLQGANETLVVKQLVDSSKYENQ